MKNKSIMYLYILLDFIAMAMISIRRARLEGLGSNVFNLPNMPLALIVIVIAIGLEIRSRNINRLGLFVLGASVVTFFSISFLLPPVGDISDDYTELSYISIMVQLSVVAVSFVSIKTRAINILFGVIVLIFLSSLGGFIYTFSKFNTLDYDPKEDAAVVLGAPVLGPHKPSPLLQGRLDAALRIFRAGIVKKIVTTGGGGQSSAEAWYLRMHGVPSSDIISEYTTSCTCEQADYAKVVLVDSLRMNHIVIITDEWHLPRALFMCRLQNVDAVGYPSELKMSYTNSLLYRAHESLSIQVYILFGA